jgi:hypothetical protein
MTHTLRRHRRPLAISTLFVALAVNVGIQDGLVPMLVILGAGTGLLITVFATAVLSGNQVVKHSYRYQDQLPGVDQQIRALEAQRAKEPRR